MWKNHNRNAICWAFYCINDNQKVDVKDSQTMRCCNRTRGDRTNLSCNCAFCVNSRVTDQD
jgi:hypothetical protein